MTSHHNEPRPEPKALALAVTGGDATLTMSSLEIAELTGKEHRNVMRDIRKMLDEMDEGGVLKFEHTHQNPQNGQTYPIFRLPKRECLILVSGYDVPLRAKIIDRWMELEGITASPVRPMDRTAAAREARLFNSHMVRMLKMAGLSGNEALLGANQATAVVVGVDMLGAAGLSRLRSENDEANVNATTIGQLLGGMRPQAVNLALLRHGYQTQFRDAKGRLQYEPTEKGKEAGGRMMDTSKRHQNGTPVKQLMWTSGIVDRLRGDLAQEAA